MEVVNEFLNTYHLIILGFPIFLLNFLSYTFYSLEGG